MKNFMTTLIFIMGLLPLALAQNAPPPPRIAPADAKIIVDYLVANYGSGN